MRQHEFMHLMGLFELGLLCQTMHTEYPFIDGLVPAFFDP
jgi:hypothetical protein